jgi:AcrR family transcriptional regulator
MDTTGEGRVRGEGTRTLGTTNRGLAARTRIREAALDLFGRQGVQATTTREILEAAGMKNPSAITYHFGSKAGLFDDLASEVITGAWPLIQLQVDLARGRTPTVEQWVALAADSASALVKTERGCLLARVWWDWEWVVNPDALEDFLASGLPLSIAWQDAIARVFPDSPPMVAVASNIVYVRTIEWIVARRARKVLTGLPATALTMTDVAKMRDGLYDTGIALLTAPTRFTEDDITLG